MAGWQSLASDVAELLGARRMGAEFATQRDLFAVQGYIAALGKLHATLRRVNEIIQTRNKVFRNNFDTGLDEDYDCFWGFGYLARPSAPQGNSNWFIGWGIASLSQVSGGLIRHFLTGHMSSWPWVQIGSQLRRLR